MSKTCYLQNMRPENKIQTLKRMTIIGIEKDRKCILQ